MKDLSRRGFLGGVAALATLPLLGRAAQAQERGHNLIVVLVSGGWDVSYALDPKPGNPNVDVPDGAVQMYGELPIFASMQRPNVHRFFEDFGSLCAVVNGVSISSIAHPECRKRILTGTNRETNPDLGAIVGAEFGSELAIPYFILGSNAFTGELAESSGRAGVSNQLVGLLDPDGGFETVSPHPRFDIQEDEEALVERYLRRRLDAERALRGGRGRNAARLDDLSASLDKAGDLQGFRPVFGQRSIQVSLRDQLELAASLVDGGVSRAVIAEDGQGWDTHVNNPAQSVHHERLYAGLHQLATDLNGRGILEDTVVAVISEMSRTPRLNAENGKDHWPFTSALVFGGPVAGGRAYGGTNELVEGVATDLATGQPKESGDVIRHENLVAGILATCGADPGLWLPRAAPLTCLKG